jgi:translation initiation factor 2B subunit (eIF-2B alpha/beta/delta family)
MVGFAGDRASGSSDVALSFLAELERWAAVDTSSSAAALRQSLLRTLRSAQASQPSFGLIHQLAARALLVADAGVARRATPVDLRADLVASCAAERDDLRRARSALAAQACALIDRRPAWIATLSHSGSVREALFEAHRRGLDPRVLLAEGRPGLEGRAMAESLGRAGIPVWLVVDASLPLLLSQATQLWIGADAVTERGVINKVGSFATALAAREHSVPTYALAERRKFLPASTPALRIVEMPTEEVWEAPPPLVEPRNVYFELVPLMLMRGIVVEDGVLPPGEAATVARDRELPPELAAAPE